MDITKELNSGPLADAFSFSREKRKAIHGLLGILTGVVADKHLNEQELLYLDVWLKNQQYLAEDSDVVELLNQVGEILGKGQISLQALDRMEARIEKFLAAKGPGATGLMGRLDELTGFLAGLAADGILNDLEITALSKWLDSNDTVKDEWPASAIVSRLETILKDGIVTTEERADLLNTVKQFANIDFASSDVSVETSTAVWEDKIDSLDIAGSTFCLTGDFVSGDRDSVHTMLKCLGANTSPNMSKQVDYLVIGTLASKNWLYTSHGRKIEKTLLLKREGVDVTIITERTLLKFTHQQDSKL